MKSFKQFLGESKVLTKLQNKYKQKKTGPELLDLIKKTKPQSEHHKQELEQDKQELEKILKANKQYWDEEEEKLNLRTGLRRII